MQYHRPTSTTSLKGFLSHVSGLAGTTSRWLPTNAIFPGSGATQHSLWHNSSEQSGPLIHDVCTGRYTWHNTRSATSYMYSWVINRLYAIDTYRHHTTFSLWCHFRQCPWDLGSAPAERVGQGKMGGFQPWAQVTWLFLGPVVESPWSRHWVSHFPFPLHEWD